jgi:hypothetical protein
MVIVLISICAVQQALNRSLKIDVSVFTVSNGKKLSKGKASYLKKVGEL